MSDKQYQLGRGFNAKVVLPHEKYSIGTVLYLKLEERSHRGRMLFAIMDRDTGRTTDYVDGNKFKNRFEEINPN